MEKPNRSHATIVGIGGNKAPLNPRLPSYLLPALKEEKGNDIILVSSMYGAAEYNADSSQERDLIIAHTHQKISFLRAFTEEFYPHKKISVDFSESTDAVEFEKWILLWDSMESLFHEEEKQQIYSILTRYNKSDSLEKAKAYAVRHAFWFKELSLVHDLGLEEYDSLESIGGKAEGFFNAIREKIEQISEETIEEILEKPIKRREVQRTIYPFSSQVVPYGEATRKSNGKIIPIEHSSGLSLIDHYNHPLCQKANLHNDIRHILENIGLRYEDFYHSLLGQYRAEFKNI